jgi:hypothetical protein
MVWADSTRPVSAFCWMQIIHGIAPAKYIIADLHGLIKHAARAAIRSM